MIRLPARMRAELLLATAIYGGLWLGDVVETIRRYRKAQSVESTPITTPVEESSHVAVVPQ